MFIYILNFLNDNLKKNKVFTFPTFEIMKDTTYLSQLSNNIKNINFDNFSNKIIRSFEIFQKYKLTFSDGISILSKLLLNHNNLSFLDEIYEELYINEKYRNECGFRYLINLILLKSKILEHNMPMAL